MSLSLANAGKNICYRCRKAASADKELLSCCYCTLYWHLDCIPPPVLPWNEEWMCPHHQKPVDPKKRSGNKSSKAKARADIIESFEEADEIIKYGGVIHNKSEEAIESEFLDYARRYRKFNNAVKKTMTTPNGDTETNDTKVKIEPEEWLEDLNAFEFCETNHTGIQMLIDAANIDSSEVDKSISLNEDQYERFEAIQELINLKGEDNLLEILSAEDQ